MSSSIVIISAESGDKKNSARHALADRVGASLVTSWLENIDSNMSGIASGNVSGIASGNMSGIDVLLVDLAHAKSAQLGELLQQLNDASPTARALLVGTTTQAPLLRLLSSTALSGVPILGWAEDFSSPELEAKILSALSESRELKQATESLTLYHQHNENLQRLSRELEERIEARRTELAESTLRLQQSQRRNDVLHRALNAVHLSQSISEIEKRLGKVLKTPHDSPGVDWVKIAFTSLSQLEAAPLNPKTSSALAVPIDHIGHVYFGRSPDKPFRAEDRTFLTPIAEAVSLAVTRLQTIERMDLVRREWEETFNSISDPVAVIDDQLNVVRGNRALIRARRPEAIIGRPCYDVIFGRSSPCSACPVMKAKEAHRGRVPESIAPQVFRMEPQPESAASKVFEVSSRPIRSNDPLEPTLLVHLYRDDTIGSRFEKRITESAQMAELGTIGSSIAHQLNNPIGGMLSLIQLLLMDLDGKAESFLGAHELRDELREMEAGTRRCAQIVRDLLGFTRRGIEDAPGEHDLYEVVQQAVKITELQTRSRGLRFEIETAEKHEAPTVGGQESNSAACGITVIGRFNLLAQAIRAVLLAMISEKLRDHVLTIHLDQNADHSRALLTVQCAGGDQNPDLTIAREIIAEHGGSLELISHSERNGAKGQPVQEARFELLAKSLTTKI